MGLRRVTWLSPQLSWMLLPLLLLLLVCLPIRANEAERAALQAQRKATQQRFVEAERSCQSRFFVNACVDDARSAQREALAPLRALELGLDEADRQQRAQQRRAAVAEKQEEAATRAGSADAVEAAAMTGAVAAGPLAEVNAPAVRERPSPKSPSTTAAAQAKAAVAAQAAQAAALAEKRVLAAQRRVQAATEAQARVDKRMAQRAARGKNSSTLPVPAAANAPPKPPAMATSAARR